MLYYEDNERRGRLAGVLAVAAYAVAVAVLLLLVRWSIVKPETAGEGILVAFGAEVSDFDAAGTNSSVDTPPVEPTDIQTQSYEEAPEAPVEVEQPRRPDPAALFPGSDAAGSTAQGAPHGAEGGNPQGTGLGSEGSGFDLAGRSIVGSLPAPNYPSNRSGRVVVDITVDAEGRVTSAAYRAQGSTTNSGELVGAAIEAARRARFTEGEGLQSGTITYNFILK
jgi:TonB family protein